MLPHNLLVQIREAEARRLWDSDISSKELPHSLYLDSKPAWFGELNYPAFGPDADYENNKIPAQVRFEQMSKK